ncbi:MAG: biotin--[acetyl-CoA-carboxylase] ligase [Sphingomonadales bacterium 32-68-7]|nr:MAG: biotin--[acetyl-CoA-carboxylase] ligase [Sphingomonadales bacterium 12-68-11]OYX09911.1 MAG: biotin--[acetyl-CoA-carboxylase] ligase [Sphingomonadales bacterium 32-68-7]
MESVAETGSTNADLIARLAAGEAIPEGYWLIADRQRAGRGRQGRRWLDGPGNFMGSTVVRLHPQDPPPPTLAFVAAMAVYETLLPRLAQPHLLRLKWPNDLLLAGAKVCGILLERDAAHAVIGIGANLACAPALPDRIARDVAEYGPAPARDAFASELAAQFDSELERWRQFGTEPLFARWLAGAHPLGSLLSVHEGPDKPVTGKFEGLGPDGALRLRLADGSLRVIHAGDVSLEGG